MNLPRLRIILGDVGFEPWTPAPDVCCATNDIFYLPVLLISFVLFLLARDCAPPPMFRALIALITA